MDPVVLFPPPTRNNDDKKLKYPNSVDYTIRSHFHVLHVETLVLLFGARTTTSSSVIVTLTKDPNTVIYTIVFLSHSFST